jgi:uncharacterized protein with NRDE domain
VCTISIIPTGVGLRLGCNRDEQRTRPEALPPETRLSGRRAVRCPIDPASGGTWVGANDIGLVAALLNRSARHPSAGRATQSRGTIVPTLLAHASITQALDAGLALDARTFEPFSVVLLQHATGWVLTSDGHTIATARLATDRPVMLTSSSLGDAVVEGPRRTLFEAMVLRDAHAWRRAQHRFHRHQWADRPEVSVVMVRPDARTVSRTTIEMTTAAAMLSYESL